VSTDTRFEDPDFDDEGEVDVEWYPVPPGLQEAWDELTAQKPVRKARARHAKNEFGHRDNLRPGMRLPLRKSDCRRACDPEVSVLPAGEFGWDGFVFANGSRLLKAITGRPDHKLTVRRYFALGGEAGDNLVDHLRSSLIGKAIVAKRSGIVYLSGDLSGLGLSPEDMESETEARLPVSSAKKLLSRLGDGDG